MILLDSLYICKSGGLRLLQYLVAKLIDHNVDFILLADDRVTGLFDYCDNVEYIRATLLSRRFIYQKLNKEITTVLCFGNIPPPFKLNIPVYTYFHNINLLKLSTDYSLPQKIMSGFKRQVLRSFKSNTDVWLVQTSNTAKELCDNLHEQNSRVMLMPFFDLPKELSHLKRAEHGEDYVYISTYVPGKGHEELLEAWELLNHFGNDNTLHLTVPFTSPFIRIINRAQKKGVNVVNHGLISFEQVMALYKHSKAIVYPSHNESLGLGLVEAMEAGCDVIASDLPFIHSICKPSCTFTPRSPESIADAIMEYEKGGCTKTKIIIENMIDDLIGLLVRKNISFDS